MAALLNFIPYLGSAVVAVTLVVVGLLTFPTLLPALVAPGLFLLLTSLEGQFVTPGILGKRLTMNPFLLFLGIGFWTWLWGPVGAFLAVPILLAGAVVARHLMADDTPDLPD
jgi:predicted PurR-regulated permease PerM